MNLNATEITASATNVSPPDASTGELAKSSKSSISTDLRPAVLVEPSSSAIDFGLAELWSYRELLYFLTWRDIKVRYKQTALGAAWAILQPVCAMLIFSLFFGRLAKMPSDNIPYPLFAYAGLLPWTFFSNAVTASGSSLVGSSNLITKVYFPRIIIPTAAVAAGLLDLAIAFLILVVMMIYYGIGLTPSILLIVPLVGMTTVLAVGVGMWMAALNVRYRDIRYALPFLIQIWMFASPVIYPTSIVPPRWQWATALNPLTGIIDGYRSALFGRPFNWLVLGISTAVTIAVFVYAAYAFRRAEDNFADII